MYSIVDPPEASKTVPGQWPRSSKPWSLATSPVFAEAGRPDG
jgi:hypothetical protein